MKARKFFSMFMIAAAICTTGFMMTSCQDEDDVVEVKYKTVNVESSEVYQTHDAVDVQITYNVVAEVSCCIERTESEWVNLIKKDINKEVNYVVRDIKFENISTEIFDDIYDSQNNKDYTLGVFKGVSFVKIKKEEEPEIEEPVEDKWENINVKSSDTYSIANGKEVVIDYSVDVRMLSNVVIDEIKNLINKNIIDGVKDISWSDESSFSASVKNILNNIPETDKYSFQNSEVTAELVKNIGNINSVSIEEGTLFTCRNKTDNDPKSNYIWSKDWTGYSKLKVKTCEIKYSDNLEIDGDGDAKDFLFEKVNVAVSDYIGGLVMKDLYLTSGERIDVFLDNVLIECEKHIKTLFNMENNNFEIVDFEIMKGAAKNYWITSHDLYGKTSGYDYKYIYNEYKAWKDNR